MERPLLRTEGLIIRPTGDSDLAGIIACGRDQLISRMPWFGIGFRDEWAPGWIERAKECWGTGPWVFSVLDEQERYLGAVALMRSSTDNSIELAYWTLAEHRNKGVLKRALSAVMAWAPDHIEASRFWAKTAPDNLPSQRALLASGFILVAQDKAVFFDWMGKKRR